MTMKNRSTRKSIHRLQRKAPQLVKNVLAMLLVILLVGQFVPAQAEILGEQARKLYDASIKPLFVASESAMNPRRLVAPQSIPTPLENAAKVSSIRLCPRQLKMYVGEFFNLVPLALDSTQKAVHAAQKSWSSSAPGVAAVDLTGEVEAKSAGTATLTLTIGSKTATVSVQVLSGGRPKLTDAQWDAEHASDCNTPISLNEYKQESNPRLKDLVRKAAYRVGSGSRVAAKALAVPAAGRGMYYLVPPLDGDSGDNVSANATAIYNQVGSPNYSAVESGGSSGIRMKRNLGSYNYSFSAPILSLGGRGVGVGLALNYNSRLWNREDSGMQFNYAKGWPAAGWTFGYGRLLQDYDAAGSGNYLLIQPDGTRIPLIKVPSTNLARSKDGSNIQLNTSNNNLLYPDGTRVNYGVVNNRLLPSSIRTRNGDILSISYRTHSAGFPFRWAIDTIQDTLGRNIVFHYYGDSGYSTGSGKPLNALASVTTPDQITGIAKELIRLEYEDIAISYNFSNPPDPNAVPATLTVVKKIYYPDTGRGYLFEDFSSYGMARKISMRMGMFESGGTVQTGTEIAYTKYNYQTNFPTTDPNYQGGPLSDSPKFTERSEYWQGKTDAQGNATSQETIYRYQRMPGMSTDTVYFPNSTNDSNNYLWKIVSTIWNDGTVSKVERLDKQDNLLERTEMAYITFSDGGTQIQELKVTNEANETTKKVFSYYPNYARMKWIDEYGFSSSTIQRRTEFEYLDGQAYIDARLINLVNKVRIYNGSNLSQPVSLSTMFYDDYAGYPHGGGMQSYGLTAATMPPTHNPNYDQNFLTRGNVTMTRSYTDVGANAYQERWSKYDIFGNVVEAEVSCCQVQSASFSGTHWWSKPDSITKGNVSGIHLTTSMLYDFYTGLVTQQTDPNNQSVSYVYDAAWRLDTTNLPTGATTVTRFDKDGNGKDLLSYFERSTYLDGVMKTITSRSWLNGTGQVLKDGTGSGIAPTTYDMSATVYDHLGRPARQLNPFQGDSSGSGSSSFYTENTYDLLSRVIQVKLPDNQLVTSTFNGSVVTGTDQVGRQRKSQVDGLGRLSKVTEQDPVTASLSLEANYSYDTLDNLTQINHGGQLRQYKFDAQSRLLYERTPEQNATINDGTGTLWSMKYTYTDFNAIDLRTDARGVVTDYNYDVLHRLETITYNVTPGVEATPQVNLTYNTASPGNGQVHSINNGVMNEVYSYDSIGRLSSTARSFVSDANTNTYTTSYEYNAISQPTAIVYPSNKRVKANYDSRGRLSGLDKYAGTTLQSTYLSSLTYNTAGQLTGATLGNGVVEAYGYSADRLQLTSQTATKNGNTLMSLSYNYQASAGQSGTSTTAGNSGQLMGVTANIGGQSRNQQFTYDNVERLVTASGWSSTTNRRFAYDPYGNRTGMWDATSGGTQIQSVVLQQSGGLPTNRLTSVTNNSVTVNYSYDANGNVTNDGNTYAYDAENRIVKVNGTAATYAYDSANRRVKKTVGTTTTYYIWVGGSVIAEYGNGQPQGSGGLKFYHADRLSTRMITNSNGVVVGTQDHLPFGEDAGTSGESEKHRIANYERDENGTDYAINRQYSNGTGRFLRPDPIDGDLNAPQTFNRYVYVANDPINLIDPLGLQIACLTFKETISGSYIGADGEEVIVIGVTERRVCFNISGGAPGGGLTTAPISVNGGATGYTPSYGPKLAFGIDEIQTCLDVIGLAPVVGEPADIANGLISAFRGDSVGATLSMASAIPVAGWFGTGGKALRRAVRAGDAGNFKMLHDARRVGDNLTPHHMPQDALGFTSRSDGGALVITQAEHAQTRTFAGAGRRTAREDAGIAFRDALARDIRDIRRIAGKKYNKGCRDLIGYYNANFAQFMRK
jgi:RHS repeat-associated protein